MSIQSPENQQLALVPTANSNYDYNITPAL